MHSRDNIFHVTSFSFFQQPRPWPYQLVPGPITQSPAPVPHENLNPFKFPVSKSIHIGHVETTFNGLWVLAVL